VLAGKPETAPELIRAAMEGDIKAGLERIDRLCHDAETVLGMYEHRISKWFADAVYGHFDRSTA